MTRLAEVLGDEGVAAGSGGQVCEQGVEAVEGEASVGGDARVVDGKAARIVLGDAAVGIDDAGLAEQVTHRVAGGVAEALHRRVARGEQPPAAGIAAGVAQRPVDAGDHVGLGMRRLDEELGEPAVGGGVQHRAGGGEPVPPRPPGLLVVLLQRRRQRDVHHLPHRGDVDAHAEGAGGDSDADSPGAEALLRGDAVVGAQVGVVEHGRMPRRQPRGDSGGAGAGARIDDGVPVGGVDDLVETVEP